MDNPEALGGHATQFTTASYKSNGTRGKTAIESYFYARTLFNPRTLQTEDQPPPPPQSTQPSKSLQLVGSTTNLYLPVTY